MKEAEAGVPVAGLRRKHGFGKSTFYKWKAKYGGMNASALRRLKELETENQRLKRMYERSCDILAIRVQVVDRSGMPARSGKL